MHCNRMKDLIDDKPGTLLCGGEVIPSERYCAPTVVGDVRLDSKLMSDEIFGPILPIIKIKNVDEGLSIIKKYEKPLALYIFSQNRTVIDRICNEISSGGAVVNDCLYQFGNCHTPFGGVGHSGLGGYHGKFSYETFSHRRTIMRRDDHLILDVPLRYPPYSDKGLSTFKFLAAHCGNLPSITKRTVGITLLAIVAGAVALILGLQFKDK